MTIKDILLDPRYPDVIGTFLMIMTITLALFGEWAIAGVTFMASLTLLGYAMYRMIKIEKGRR